MRRSSCTAVRQSPAPEQARSSAAYEWVVGSTPPSPSISRKMERACGSREARVHAMSAEL